MLVVTPRDPRFWRRFGNRSFYRLFGLHHFMEDPADPAAPARIAKSKLFYKDGVYPQTTSYILQPGVSLLGESMPRLTNVDPTAPEQVTFTDINVTVPANVHGVIRNNTSGGALDCFTGNSILAVDIENIGMNNFTHGFNIGTLNTLGIAKSRLARILFSNAAGASTTPLAIQNFQNLRLDQIYAWIPASTSNFMLMQNVNGNWNGGNSFWTDLFCHGCKNVNGAIQLLAIVGYLNMIEAHRVQVNMQDAAFANSTSGYGLYMQGQSSAALCQNNEFYGLDIEGGPLRSVRLEDWSLNNYIHLAYSVHTSGGFDFSLKKNLTGQAPLNNLLVFHSNTGGVGLNVECDNFNNLLLTSQALNPITGSYPSGISGYGTANLGGAIFGSAYGGGSGETFVGATTSNIPGGTQTAPLTMVTFSGPVVQQFEAGGNLNVTAFTSGPIQVQVTFTDQNSNAQTITVPLITSSGTVVSGANGTGWYSFYLPVTSKASSNIVLKTVGTFTASYYCAGFIRATA